MAYKTDEELKALGYSEEDRAAYQAVVDQNGGETAGRRVLLNAELQRQLAAKVQDPDGDYRASAKALEEGCGLSINPSGIELYDKWWSEKGCEIWTLATEGADVQEQGSLIEKFNKCSLDSGGEGSPQFGKVNELYNKSATMETLSTLAGLGTSGTDSLNPATSMFGSNTSKDGITNFQFETRGGWTTGDKPEGGLAEIPAGCDSQLKAVEDNLKKIKELWDEQKKIVQQETGVATARGDIIDQDIADKLCEASEKLGGSCADVDTLQADTATMFNRDGFIAGMDRESSLMLQGLYRDILVGGYKEMQFKEQCYLLAKIFDLAHYKVNILEKTEGGEKKLPYAEPTPDENASLMMAGDPYGFMNRLTQHPAQDAFFNMKTEEISSLQPMIRLYKVIQADAEEDKDNPCVGGEGEIEHEFLFDAYASRGDVESLLSDSTKRGFGVGISKFSFVYDGHDPFAAKKSIKAQLQIFASSFDELLKDRPAGLFESGHSYKYADLALKTWTKKDKLDTASAVKDPAVAPSAACRELEQIKEENKSKLSFRLKAVIGWARPSGNTGLFTTMTEDQEINVLEAINESSVTLNLTPTTHDFNIDDMGRVRFTINYLAYVEDFFDQPQFDIFYVPEVAVRQKAREYAYKALAKEKCSDNVAVFKKHIAENGVVRRDKFRNTQSLIKQLVGDCETNQGKIKYIELSHEELAAFQTKGPFHESGKGVTITDNPSNTFAVADAVAQTYQNALGLADPPPTGAVEAHNQAVQQANLNFALAVSDPTKETIAFFYVSDLLDVILKGIEERLKTFSEEAGWTKVYKELANTLPGDMSMDMSGFKSYWTREKEKMIEFKRQFKKYRLLMGPLEILNPKSNKKEKKLGTPPSDHVNFGDVPISVKYFMEWMTEKMTKKEQSQYHLSKFLTDFFNDLLSNFLNNDTCFSFNTKQTVRLNKAAVTSYKECKWQYDEITKWIIDYSSENNLVPRLSRADIKLMSGRTPKRAILNISGPQGTPLKNSTVGNEINYMVFFAGRTQPVELMNGSRTQDAQNGIFHYLIGRPRGIVKTINLSKTSATGLKEVRFEQEGFEGLEQLREVYDVNIDCYANVKTFPGTYIFVDPRGFAPNTTSYTKEGELDIMDLTKYGIGGYCMIIRSEHEFGPGQASTKLTAKWVAQLETEDERKKCAAASNKNTAGDGSEKAPCDA